jgi:hypothetical protein
VANFALYSGAGSGCSGTTDLSATYGGVAMDKTIPGNGTANFSVVFTLANGTASGVSQDLVLSGLHSECTGIQLAVASYTGFAQQLPEATSSTYAAPYQTTASASVIPLTANAWVIGASYIGGTTGYGADTYNRGGTYSTRILESSLNPITPIATTTLIVNYNYGQNNSGAMSAFSLKQYVPTDSIQIDFPENATSTPDFSLWSVSGYALDSGDTIEILSQATSSNTWVIDGGRYLGDIGSFSDFVIVKNTSAIPDIYRAYATLYHGIDIVATSTEIVYTITGANPEIGGYYGESGYYPDTYPTSTASSSDWVITCDPTDPLFTRSICQISKWTLDGINALLQFLFIPKSSDLNQFNNLKSALENKPPFGYFYAIKDALIFNSTTTKAFDIASSTLAMVSPIFNPLKTGITFILWLLFAFWVFNRLRNFHFI